MFRVPMLLAAVAAALAWATAPADAAHFCSVRAALVTRATSSVPPRVLRAVNLA